LLYGYIWITFFAVQILFITVSMATEYSCDQLLSLRAKSTPLFVDHDRRLLIFQLGLCRHDGCQARLATRSVTSLLSRTSTPGEIPVISGHLAAVFTNNHQLLSCTHEDWCPSESAVFRCWSTVTSHQRRRRTPLSAGRLITCSEWQIPVIIGRRLPVAHLPLATYHDHRRTPVTRRRHVAHRRLISQYYEPFRCVIEQHIKHSSLMHAYVRRLYRRAASTNLHQQQQQ